MKHIEQRRAKMMINKVILMGRLTRDPELRHTGSGTPVCSFSLAISSGYGESQVTDFVSCIAWNKTAEFVDKYFEKGRMAIVEGRISTRTWEGKDGKKNYATEVVASEVRFGESKKVASASNGSNERDVSEFVELEDDDLTWSNV